MSKTQWMFRWRLVITLMSKAHASDYILEILKSYCFLHEYVKIDNFVFTTDGVSKFRGSELDPCTDSKDKVFTVAWFGWVELFSMSLIIPAAPVSILLPPSCLLITLVWEIENWGQWGRGRRGKHVHREGQFAPCTTWKSPTSHKDLHFASRESLITQFWTVFVFHCFLGRFILS